MNITVTRDSEQYDLFHVTGRRVSGTVRASITISENKPYAVHDGDDPEVIGVTVMINPHREGESLTVNGVALNGYATVRINDRFRPNLYAGGYLRRFNQWGADSEASDAAREAWHKIVCQVADLYGTDERVNAQRLARSAERLEDAIEAAAAANDALRAARESHTALTRSDVQVVKRPVAAGP